MQFIQVDVFAEEPFRGNQLAVIPDREDLSDAQMQAIAREMNLSETTFVSRVQADRYEVRIFTPWEELPFAGHPTLGTAFALSELGLIKGDEITQVSAAGETPVRREGDLWSFTRPGSSSQAYSDRGAIARAIGCDERALTLEARGTRLAPAFSDIGFPQLMVPISDPTTLARLIPVSEHLEEVSHEGVYCFTFTGDDRIEARGFFPSLGIPEDPATGSAAGALGVYLADRLGDVEVTIDQGLHIERPSLIRVRATAGQVEVGGRCHLILRGTLDALP